MTPVGFVSRVDTCHAGHTQLTLSEMNDGLLAGMVPSKLRVGDVYCELVAISHEYRTICVSVSDSDFPRITRGVSVCFDWQAGGDN